MVYRTCTYTLWKTRVTTYCIADAVYLLLSRVTCIARYCNLTQWKKYHFKFRLLNEPSRVVQAFLRYLFLLRIRVLYWTYRTTCYSWQCQFCPSTVCPRLGCYDNGTERERERENQARFLWTCIAFVQLYTTARKHILMHLHLSGTTKLFFFLFPAIWYE